MDEKPKTAKRLQFLCVCTALLLIGGADNTQKTPRNVILIGWDAADRRNVKEYMEKGALPNLKSLSSEGTMVAIDIARFTDTKAGWSQILTGYEPETTGVFSNKLYKPIPRGLTIFERLEKFFGPENITTAAVIGKKRHVDADAPARRKISRKELGEIEKKRAEIAKADVLVEDPVILPTLEVDGDDTYQKQPGKPFFHAKAGMDIFINGLMKDDLVGKKALQLLERHRHERFFFFIHFAQIDHSGHKHGEGSKQHRKAYKSADRWTGIIVNKLKEMGLYEETVVYVTSDHGFMQKGLRHWDAPYVFLATNDKGVLRRGDRGDIAPTILDRFGVDLDAIDPPLDGRSLLKPYEPPKW